MVETYSHTEIVESWTPTGIFECTFAILSRFGRFPTSPAFVRPGRVYFWLLTVFWRWRILQTRGGSTFTHQVFVIALLTVFVVDEFFSRVEALLLPTKSSESYCWLFFLRFTNSSDAWRRYFYRPSLRNCTFDPFWCWPILQTRGGSTFTDQVFVIALLTVFVVDEFFSRVEALLLQAKSSESYCWLFF